MIVGERKPFGEIKQSIGGYKNILLLGCGTCVSVCMAGGEKEVELLASQLKMAYNLEGKAINITEKTIQRQCDREYIDPIVELANKNDAVLSMGCGAGVQFLAELIDSLPVIPAINTRFIGIAQAEGSWAERCRACGDCRLASYGGICPVTVCAKGLLNGPCGGASKGKCEAGNDKDCAWELIYNRLKQQKRLDNFLEAFNFYNNALQAHPARVSKDS